MHDLLAGLSGSVGEALTSPPADEKALLELRLAWPGLTGLEARVAARLRVFLLTWDPLGWLWDRAAGWATATGDGDVYEIVLYLPFEAVFAHAKMLETTVADSLALWGESAIALAARQEPLLASGAYAKLAAEGKAPGLLSEPRGERAWELPAIQLASSGWEPIGLGAIQDLVQEAFGPVELDRARVRLDPAARSDPHCPACAGRSFGFPAELEEPREVMCGVHRAQAEQVRNERLARAMASNPDGWATIVEASARLDRPSHGLPLGLFGRLEAVLERDPRRRLSEEELRTDAELALALAAQFAGQPQAFHDFQFESDLFVGDWLVALPFTLSNQGLVDEAVRVGDAYAELWEESSSLFANDVAVILARAGRAAEALARVEQNLRRFSDDLWTRIHAGDVHGELGDAARAETAYRGAAELAIELNEPDAAAGAWERLAEVLRRQPGRKAEARDAALEAEAWRLELDDDDELLFEEPYRAGKVGRNEPCPCGSGRKYKRCCGR